jgi:hypothetical protein
MQVLFKKFNLRKMKKLLIFISAIATVSLTSCLKDKPTTDFSSLKGEAVLELPYAGLQYFSSDAITDSGDTIVKKFGVNIASVNPLTTDTKYTIEVDYSLLTAYQAKNTGVTYETAMPDGSFTIDKMSGTIKAGQRLDSITVTFYKSKLDPSKSYMLPIKLASTSNGILSGNFNAHYYHFIGNDFAGIYEQFYTRWSIPDTSDVNNIDNNHRDVGPTTFLPVTPNEFTVQSYYYYGIPYHVTFTKTGSGATATYSDWTIFFTSDDIASYFTNPSGGAVALGSGPFIDPYANFDPSQQYTYAESLKLFRFFYLTSGRAVIDQYIKQ